MEFIRFIFSNVGPYFGALIMLAIILTFIHDYIKIWAIRKNIKDHGWPPDHCDSLGENKYEEYDK